MNLPPFTAAGTAPEDRMHWVLVPFEEILEMYHAHVLKVQRNHVRRAKSSPHLTASNIPTHVNFLAGRTPDLKARLVDGYTRITAILNGDKPAPKNAWLGVVDCSSPSELEKLYDAMDSRMAVKRGRDAYEEGLRRAGLLGKVKSPAFVRGQVVSAIIAAAGTSDIRKATWEMRHGIAVLDPLHLSAGRNGLPSGAFAGLLLLATHETDVDKVQKYAYALQHPDQVPKELREVQAGALRCAVHLAERRETGALSGKNVGPIMELVLGYWDFQGKGAKGFANVLSREDYLAKHAEKKVKETAAA